MIHEDSNIPKNNKFPDFKLKEIKMMENLLSSVEFEKEFKENVKEYL